MQTMILGATGGIGAATARAFAAQGDTLTLSGRDEGKLAQIAAELGAASRVADVGFESHVRTLLEGAPRAVFGKPRHPRIEQFLDTYLDRGAAMLV